MLKTVRTAVSFLTRIPLGSVADITAADLARASALFPLVGALIGLAQAGCALALPATTPPALTGILLVAVSAAMSGALHLDGLADTFDALGAPVGRDERLRIMRDPHVGTFGTTALIIVLLIKSSAVAALFERHQLRALVFAASVARFCPSLLTRLFPPARTGGSGKALADGVSTKQVTGAAIAVVLVAVLSGTSRPWVGGIVAVGVAVALGAIAYRQLGGVTGDIFGASIELAETAVLLASLVQ
jgi:adenosylcobinamide-GDP ribazoletransferase